MWLTDNAVGNIIYNEFPISNNLRMPVILIHTLIYLHLYIYTYTFTLIHTLIHVLITQP